MISTMIFCSITCMVVCVAAMVAIITVLMSRIASLERRLDREIAGIKEDIVRLEREFEFDPFAECDPPPDPKHRPGPLDMFDLFGHE